MIDEGPRIFPSSMPPFLHDIHLTDNLTYSEYSGDFSPRVKSPP